MNITLPNGFTPRDVGQRGAMTYFDKGGLRGVYCWPRRFGKDLTFAHQTAKAMFERKGMYLHMLPNHKQARKVIWDGFDNEGNRIIDKVFPKEIRASQNETEMKIVMKNGSLWQLVGSDYFDSIVGSNPVGIVMSEAALSDPRAWDYFRPMLAGNGGWAAFISTPRGYNWFWRLLEYAKTDKKWDWSHLTVEQTKHIKAGVLADEKRQMPDELFRQEYWCDFSAANVGAIFGRYIEQAEREGRLTSLAYEADADVWVTSDIGYRDKAAFWWWRIVRGGFELFDYVEGTGMDAEEWLEKLKEKTRANVLVLPHDARAKTFQSRHTVAEQFARAGVADEVRVNPPRKKADSINAGRVVLRRCVFDKEHCAQGLEALRAYHFKYDEEQRAFSHEPDHDWSCTAEGTVIDGAGAVEYVRVGDTVKTPVGWRAVTAVYRYEDVPLLEVTLADGRRVKCSPTHEWFTARGLVRTNELLESDVLFTGGEKAWRYLSLIFAGVGTTSASLAAISRSVRRASRSVMEFAAACSTAICGRPSVGRFLTAARSIIGMATRATTTLATSNCSVSASTSDCTDRRMVGVLLRGIAPRKDENITHGSHGNGGSAILKASSGHWSLPSPVLERRRASGMAVPTGLHGIVSTQGGWRHLLSPWQRLVRCVVRGFLRRIGSRSTAGRVVGVRPIGRGTVYGLTVEREHCYVANGMLSANSHASDAFMEGAAVVREFVEKMKPVEPGGQLAGPMNYAWSLDDLWSTARVRSGEL